MKVDINNDFPIMGVVSMIGMNDIPISLLKLGDDLFSLNAGFEKGYFYRYVRSASIYYIGNSIILKACDISDDKIQYEVELDSSMISKFFSGRVQVQEVGI